MKHVLLSAFCLFLALSARGSAQAPKGDKAEEFFESRIRPILAEHCYSCHGPKKQQAGLRLDRREAITKGADGEPVIVPGQPDKSTLLRAVRHEGDVKMPPKGKLPPQAIADLTTWVKQGAFWPKDKDTTA